MRVYRLQIYSSLNGGQETDIIRNLVINFFYSGTELLRKAKYRTWSSHKTQGAKANCARTEKRQKRKLRLRLSWKLTPLGANSSRSTGPRRYTRNIPTPYCTYGSR